MVGFLTNPCKPESSIVTVQPNKIESWMTRRLEVLHQRIGMTCRGVSKEVPDLIGRNQLVEAHQLEITPNVDGSDADATKDVVGDR